MQRSHQLSKREITEILVLVAQGHTKTELAKRYQVDRSTVTYHIKKASEAYPEQSTYYGLIKLQQRAECVHWSARCSICGEMWNKIDRAERYTIAQLKDALLRANARLRIAGLPVEEAG